MPASNYLRNKLLDWYWRGQTYTPPATHYIGLLISTKGLRANGTVYAVADTVSITATDGLRHLYKCVAAGTSASAQPATYTGVASQTVVDGTATFTEQTAAVNAGTAAVEPSGGAYARVSRASSLANFAGSQAAGSTAASSGTNGTTSNNASMQFPAPTANWRYVWAAAEFDAATAGNLLNWTPLNAEQDVISGGSTPGFPISALKWQIV